MEVLFLLKKFIAYFFKPFGIILITMLIGFYHLLSDKIRNAKIYLSFSVFLFLLFSYPPFANFLIYNLESQYPKYEYKDKISYIHVLGNGHNDDPLQPLSSQLGDTSLKRDLEGIIIHLNSKDSKIIFTGYAGTTSITAAEINANLAIALGIDENNIIINGKPKDTQEEALFAKELIGEEPFVLVTSASHMLRSMMLFKSLGMNPIAAPTDFQREHIDTYIKAPKLDSLYTSQIAMHEYLGILWSKLKSLFS